MEANRMNAQKSTGPRTDAGKAKAAANSYQHGFFAKHLFPTAEQRAKDYSDYLTVANGVYKHYQPEGFMENFWLEKIATEAVRLARVVGYKQELMIAWRSHFWGSAADRILRYQTTANRRLTEAIEELERLQAKRKVDTVLPGPPELEASDSVAEVERPTQCPRGQADEAPTDKAIAESDSTVTAADCLREQSDVAGSDAGASAERWRNEPTSGRRKWTNYQSISKRLRRSPETPEPSSDSPQEDESVGTYPHRTLSDRLTQMLDEDP
jgi:hypothetical protein